MYQETDGNFSGALPRILQKSRNVNVQQSTKVCVGAMFVPELAVACDSSPQVIMILSSSHRLFCARQWAKYCLFEADRDDILAKVCMCAHLGAVSERTCAFFEMHTEPHTQLWPCGVLPDA